MLDCKRLQNSVCYFVYSRGRRSKLTVAWLWNWKLLHRIRSKTTVLSQHATFCLVLFLQNCKFIRFQKKWICGCLYRWLWYLVSWCTVLTLCSWTSFSIIWRSFWRGGGEVLVRSHLLFYNKPVARNLPLYIFWILEENEIPGSRVLNFLWQSLQDFFLVYVSRIKIHGIALRLIFTDNDNRTLHVTLHFTFTNKLENITSVGRILWIELCDILRMMSCNRTRYDNCWRGNHTALYKPADSAS
jgi:hypothetical protein